MLKKKFFISNRNGNQLHSIFFPSNRIDSSYKKSILIILCHGFKGDKSEKKRFFFAALELNKAGFDALVFDFSGSGENKREPILLSRQATDLEDVAEWAMQNSYSRIGTIGLSFGGVTSLIAKLPTREAAVFWAPAMYPKKAASLFELILSRVINNFPSVTVKRNSSGDYPPILINSYFTKEAFCLNADFYLKRFTIPSLILQGKEDTVVKPEITEKAYLQMPQDNDHQYKIIHGAAHDFDGAHLSVFIDYTIQFLLRYL